MNRISRTLRFTLVGALALALPAGAMAITRQDAYRMGQKGQSTTAILKKAFPGVRMARTQEAPIRVLLADDVMSAGVTARTALVLRDGGNAGFAPVTLTAGHRYEVTRAGNRLRVRSVDGGPTYTLRGPVEFDSNNANTGILLAEPASVNRRYRGVIRVLPGRQNRVRIINVLDVQYYLQGTLPGDMPPAWGAKAPTTLSAGAIALRSRALHQRKLPTAPFDFTASDPKYLGLDGERVRATRAVQRTRHLTLRKGRLPYPANFTKGARVMGSTAFQPLPGTPVPVAFGPTKAVEGASPTKALAAMNLALRYKGTPYRWGGSAPGGFDCSGLLYYVFGQQGVRLPRVAEDQARAGQPVRTIEELLPGDLVFFADSSGYIHHIGIYIGGGKMVHAPRTGDVVKESTITSGYFRRQFAGGRRITG